MSVNRHSLGAFFLHNDSREVYDYERDNSVKKIIRGASSADGSRYAALA